MVVYKVSVWVSVALLVLIPLATIPADSCEFKTQDIDDDYPFKENYPSVDELYEWYEHLESEYPDIVTKHHIGRSWEGRDLWVLELSASDYTMTDDRPAVLIDGGMHAREWSSVQVAAYFIWKTVTQHQRNDTIDWLLNNRKIFICPMVNPDGYIYDGDGEFVTGSQGRMWRKNRNYSTPTDSVGVDLNRNWDIYWDWADDDPSRETYRGEAPFSENETSALKDFILEYDIQSYQNLHSFGGFLLIPWSHSPYPNPHEEWYLEVAGDMVSQTSLLGEGGREYTFGTAYEKLEYNVQGGAADWVYKNTGAHSFVFEIYTGVHRFYPPEKMIMDINRGLTEALFYQTRIADVDLGHGDELLYPPSPHIIFGGVEDADGVVGTDVRIKNRETGESISIETDSNGYYELNLGNMVEEGYHDSDVFHLSADGTSFNFTLDGSWGHRFDLTTTPDSAPEKVEGLEAEKKNGEVHLNWDEPEDSGYPIFRYNIYRDGELIGHTSENTFLDPEFNDGDHHYRVSAVNSGGEGPPSENVEVTFRDYTIYYIALGAAFIVIVISGIYRKKTKRYREEELTSTTVDETGEPCPRCSRNMLEVNEDLSAYCEGCEYAVQDIRDSDGQ